MFFFSLANFSLLFSGMYNRRRTVVSVPCGPSALAVKEAAWGLARYAAISQVCIEASCVRLSILFDDIQELALKSSRQPVLKCVYASCWQTKLQHIMT